MKKFKDKKQVFSYIKRKYLGKNTFSILIKGSSINRDIKEFSDIDVEICQKEKKKPDYEIVLVKGNLALITAYFYRPGKKMKNLENSLLIYGDYYEPTENQGDYTKEERRIRDSQMFIDFLFKYLRTKDPKYLEKIEKYCRLK